jgi:hypothetical protein
VRTAAGFKFRELAKLSASASGLGCLTRFSGADTPSRDLYVIGRPFTPAVCVLLLDVRSQPIRDHQLQPGRGWTSSAY